jgi:excisionase family DNA binding protein
LQALLIPWEVKTMVDVLACTADEARQVLKVGRNLIYKLLRTGDLKGKRVGKKWIIARAEMERWLREERKE